METAGQGRLRQLRLPRLGRQPVSAAEAGEDGAVRHWLVEPDGSRRVRPYPPLLTWLHHLHADLLAGETGKLLLGLLGGVLIAACVSGLALWGPGRWGRTWRFHWRGGGKRLLLDSHAVVGTWLAAPLLLAAVTGMGMVFRADLLNGAEALGWIGAAAKPPAVATSTGAATPDLDRLAAEAELRFPGARLTAISLPAKPGQPVSLRLRLRLPGEIHPNGRSFAWADPASGQILAESRTDRQYALRQAVDQWIFPLHVASPLGAAGPWLTALLGLATAALPVTGATLWWTKRRRKRKQSQLELG